MIKPANTSTQPFHAENVTGVPVDLIDIEPQIRTRNGFDPQSIAELAESIKIHGLLSPLLLEPIGERFRLIAGHRRFAALQSLKMTHAPALIHQADDLTRTQKQMVENIQRENLKPLDIAAGVRALLDTMKKPALVAKSLGKSGAWVSKHAALTSPRFAGKARALLEDDSTDDIELAHTINQLVKLSASHDNAFDSQIDALCANVRDGNAGRAAARDLLDACKLAPDADPGNTDGEGEDDPGNSEVYGKLELDESAARMLAKAINAYTPKNGKERATAEAVADHLQGFILATWPQAQG